ncbi:MAG: S8 family serine peptidase [Vicinamibacterales bacterium]
MLRPHSRALPFAAACTALALSLSDAQSGRTILAPGPMGVDLGQIQLDAAALAPGFRTGRSEAAFDADEIIVAFESGALTAQSAGDTIASAGLSPQAVSYPDSADFAIVRLAPGEDPESAAALLDGAPGVRYAQPRYRVYADARPNDPLYAQQWNFPLIDLERAWDINPGSSQSIIVAVVDTGIAHRDLTVSFPTRAWTFRNGDTIFNLPSLGTIAVPFSRATDLGPATSFVSPRDFIWNDTTPLDLDGHGTHVAGTIAQATNNSVGTAGVAYNVRLMPVKVLSNVWDFVFGNSRVGTDDVVAQGIRYAADNGANIINMSLGRSGGAAPAIESALRYAVDRGVFVALTAGNNFENGNPLHRFAEIASRIAGVMAVSAVGPDRAKAPYSNTGAYVEIAAPGGNSRLGPGSTVLQQSIFSGDSNSYLGGPEVYTAPRFDRFSYRGFQGTSMAAPHVAGLAALLMHQGIRNPAVIERMIARFATDLGTSGRDDTFGHGLISARATLRGLGLGK